MAAPVALLIVEKDAMPSEGDVVSVAGWREWVALPDLGVGRLRCKLDTGARTSALHATFVESLERDGAAWVRFGLRLETDARPTLRRFEAPVVDRRVVTDSGGHRERRVVIATRVTLGARTWPIEVTLANRETMRFRMLLGRAALRGRVLVDPGASYLQGEPEPTR